MNKWRNHIRVTLLLFLRAFFAWWQVKKEAKREQSRYKKCSSALTVVSVIAHCVARGVLFNAYNGKADMLPLPSDPDYQNILRQIYLKPYTR